MVNKIAVIGLGYVGMPLALEFAKKVPVVGFDTSVSKIKTLIYEQENNQLLNDMYVSDLPIEFTNNEEKIRDADFIIIAVPTPVDNENKPDFTCLVNASKIVGKNMMKDAIVVYESTVYPGATEEICIPVLEEYSGYHCGTDFGVGYSPERINPGDKVHNLVTIVKIVSGINKEIGDKIAEVYQMILKDNIYRASSIKVAEAAKIIENTQRDVNIALMNELSVLMKKIGIEINEVIDAAKTKWNFMDVKPGLVGGHCIGVDPYYLIDLAEKNAFNPEIMKLARKINNNVPKNICKAMLEKFHELNINEKNAKVLVLGFTYKENVADIRNTKVMDIINELSSYGIKPYVSDVCADKELVKSEYGLDLYDYNQVNDVDAILITVAHDEYKKKNLADFMEKFKGKKRLIFDCKNILNIEQTNNKDIIICEL